MNHCTSRQQTEFTGLQRRGRRRQRQESFISWKSLTLWVAASFCCSTFDRTTTTAFTTPHRQQPRQQTQQHTRNPSRRRTSLRMVETLAGKGLSRYFQNILSRTNGRQRFVTGKYPVIVTIEENPTQKWLDKDSATSLLLVNGTAVDKSLASYDRFQWLDDKEREELQHRYASMTLELLAEIHMSKPGYVQILSSNGAGSSAEALRELQEAGSTTRWNRWSNSTLYQKLILDELQKRQRGPVYDRLWVTGFSLAGRKGFVKSMDVSTGHMESVNARSEAMTLWPNEVNAVPQDLVANPILQDSSSPQVNDALLISDGFLVPGKDRGGIYIVKNPGNPHSEWTTCLTDLDGDRWFYHRAAWVDLTNDGRQSILTARAKLRKVAGKSDNLEESRPKNGQLVWLEMPKPHHYDKATGTPLEEDGTAFDPFSLRHLPWKERVLATGPDVMFTIADLDTDDDTIEVIASQFFDKKVTLHSIKRGPKPRVSFSRMIDARCGAAFGGILADLDPAGQNRSGRRVLDSGSTVPTVRPGDSFSHVLVTSHECNYAETEGNDLIEITDSPHQAVHNERSESLDGGSLFSYRVPEGKDGWKTKPWTRTTVATGFKVKGQFWNVINPGAPGFVYTFHAKQDDSRLGKRPMIAIAGDCAESAYIFRPDNVKADHGKVYADPEAQYKLMCEIKCGATVGSIGVGYDDLCSAEQESGYAKLYIPCYEEDKILVFAMGSGEGAEDDEDWYEAKSHLI